MGILTSPLERAKLELGDPPFPRSGVRFGFAEADDAVAFLPLIAAFEDFDAFEAFENVALGAERAGAFETTMLSHKIVNFLGLPVRGTGLVPQRRVIATGYSQSDCPRCQNLAL